jgi:hypothetical protein
MSRWGDIEITKKNLINIYGKYLFRLRDRVILHNGMSDPKACVECAIFEGLQMLSP